MKCAVALAFGAMLTAVTLSAAVVRAEGPSQVDGTAGHATPRLEWIRELGAESCVSKEELDRLLAQMLGGRGGPSGLGQSSIEGLVSRGRAPQTWMARVRIVSAEGSILGQREFSTSEEACSALTPSVLLVLLILIDPEAADRGMPNEVLQSMKPGPAAAPPTPSSASEPWALPAPRRSVTWQVHLEPSANIGLLSGPALGLTGGVSLVTPDGWQLALSGGYAGKAMIALEPNAYVLGGHILVSGLLVDLSVCPVLTQQRSLRLSACVGAAFVTRFFETPGLEEHTDPARSSLGPSVSTQAGVALTESWQLRGYLSSALLMPRENFVYQDGSNVVHRVYTPSRFFGSVGLGLATNL